MADLITDGEIIHRPGVPSDLTLYNTRGHFYLWDGAHHVELPNGSVESIAEGARMIRCAQRHARGENPYGPEMQAMMDEALYHDAGRAAVREAYRKGLGTRGR
jgi:hypothetical protein